MVWKTDRFKDSEEYELFIHLLEAERAAPSKPKIASLFPLDKEGFPLHGEVKEVDDKLYWIKIVKDKVDGHRIAYIYRKKEWM